MTFLARLIALLCALAPLPAAAQVVVIEEWVEVVEAPGAARFVSPQHAEVERSAIATFGPFRVIDARTAALVGTTDSRSPRQFAALLRAFPEIAVLEFVEVPGTADDLANMALGRMIRAAGLTTRVSAGGSVRSGGVELFVAGARQVIAEGSEFAVHGWLDDRGMGAGDYAPGAPEHRRYLDYYREMGMGAAQAEAFYAMTNSVPFEQARWLTAGEMAGWLGMEAALPLPPQPEQRPEPRAKPQIAYLDLGLLVP